MSTLFFCSLAGFAFAKLRFKGSNALMVVVILTLTIPNQLGIVALYIVMGELGWNGTLLAVIVPGLVSAFGVFYMRQFIVDAVPDELIEAARVDGALHHADVLEHRAAGHPAGAGGARPAHLRGDLERLPVAADHAERHRLPRPRWSRCPTWPAATTCSTAGCSRARSLATVPLLVAAVPRRPADRPRHHGRRGEA